MEIYHHSIGFHSNRRGFLSADSDLTYNGGRMQGILFSGESTVTVDIQIYSGKDMEPMIEMLAEFRLRYFHEFPYLYAGTVEGEKGHLAEYLANPSTRLLIAKDDENVVGVGIGTLLSTEKDILEQISEACERQGINPTEFFYFGEMIFTPEYRGRGVGKRMLDMLKNAGSDQGATRFCFLAVDRDANDPRRPNGQVDSGAIFQKFGFRKTSIQVVFDWPTVPLSKPPTRCLCGWMRKLDELAGNANFQLGRTAATSSDAPRCRDRCRSN